MHEIEVRDLRGLPFGDPARQDAYPHERFTGTFQPLQYIHLCSTSWYFDASNPRNAAEAEETVARQIKFAEEYDAGSQSPYVPFLLVIDNYGATIIGRRS